MQRMCMMPKGAGLGMKSLEEATTGAVQSFCKGRPEFSWTLGQKHWIGPRRGVYLWWLLAKGSRGAVINTPAIFISKRRAVGCYRCPFTGEDLVDGRGNYYLQEQKVCIRKFVSFRSSLAESEIVSARVYLQESLMQNRTLSFWREDGPGCTM
ncbi:hypothetical protein DL98DRAFT_206320 [Cadophora sp. DSE1049]|nr:hypothetical protein DL98DRAFT_206320 [Cadophora sp. DSE1049]